MASYSYDDFGDDEDFGLGEGVGDADEGQLPDSEAVPAGAAEPAAAGGASQGAPAERPHGGDANGHSQQQVAHPPQASGHVGPADDDPDELDLYGDMAASGPPSAGMQRQPSAAETVRAEAAAGATASPASASAGAAPGQPPAGSAGGVPGPAPPPGPPPGSKVYIGNLQWWTTDAQLEGLAREFGTVNGVKIFEDTNNGKSKGAAEIEFAEPTAAAKCKAALHGKDIDGKACVVTLPRTGVKLKTPAAAPMAGRGPGPRPPNAPFMGPNRPPAFNGRGGPFLPTPMIGGFQRPMPMGGPGRGMPGMGAMPGRGMNGMMAGRGMNGMGGMPGFGMGGGMPFAGMRQGGQFGGDDAGRGARMQDESAAKRQRSS